MTNGQAAELPVPHITIVYITIVYDKIGAYLYVHCHWEKNGQTHLRNGDGQGGGKRGYELHVCVHSLGKLVSGI